MPIRLLICGCSGSGKTQLFNRIFNNLESKYNPDGKFLICPTANRQKGYDKDENIKYTKIYDDADNETFLEVYEKCKDLDPETRKIIVLDDCVETELLKRNSVLTKEITRCRHYKIDIIMLVQMYKSVLPIIRNNLSHLIVFPCNNKKELAKIIDEQGDDFADYYEKIKNTRYAHILVNLEENLLSGNRYICNDADGKRIN